MPSAPNLRLFSCVAISLILLLCNALQVAPSGNLETPSDGANEASTWLTTEREGAAEDLHRSASSTNPRRCVARTASPAPIVCPLPGRLVRLYAAPPQVRLSGTLLERTALPLRL
jgi:hypothetical protein